MTKQAANQNGKQLATVKAETVDLVLKKVQAFQNNGELDLPPNYSAANALKSAWLRIQETEDMSHKKALDVCTKNSIANALLNTVIQGLNPEKNQCYYIVYGKKLVMQRSYFGTMAVTKRVMPSIADDGINAEVIYSGDKIEYEIVRGKKCNIKHKQKMQDVEKSKIIGAYCEIYGRDGKHIGTEVMTIDEIKQSWMQSKMKPIDDNGDIKPGSTHGKFTADMCKRTVINKCCKPIWNSSDDSNLVLKSIRQTDEVRAEAEAEIEADEYANQGDVIDIEHETVPDTQEDTGSPENGAGEPEGEAETEEGTDQEGEPGDEPDWMK